MSDKHDAELDSDDSLLFRQAVGEVTPVNHDRVEPIRKPARPLPRYTQADEQQVLSDMLSDYFEPAELDTGEELYYVRPGLQHGVLRKLRRGQFRVAAVVDLHGMNVETARRTLTAFLAQARREHLTCVRIIHGKGRRSKHKGPVIKTKVNSWLRQRDEVLAFCSSRPVDGGTGAVDVLLRRR